MRAVAASLLFLAACSSDTDPIFGALQDASSGSTSDSSTASTTGSSTGSSSTGGSGGEGGWVGGGGVGGSAGEAGTAGAGGICQPLTCDQIPLACHSPDDGCGATLNCGDTCATPKICDFGTNSCICGDATIPPGLGECPMSTMPKLCGPMDQPAPAGCTYLGVSVWCCP